MTRSDIGNHGVISKFRVNLFCLVKETKKNKVVFKIAFLCQLMCAPVIFIIIVNFTKSIFSKQLIFKELRKCTFSCFFSTFKYKYYFIISSITLKVSKITRSILKYLNKPNLPKKITLSGLFFK